MTIYHWRRNDYGPQGRRVGRYLRYRPEEVRAWFDEQGRRRAEDAPPTAADRHLREHPDAQGPAGGYRAFTRFRDHDGVTRKVERNGPTEAAAKNRLREHLRDRAQQSSRDGLHGESKFLVAADEWIASIDRLVAQGLRSPNTAQLYRLNLNTHVLPALGELRLHEVTVPRLDKVIQTLLLRQGAATAKIARTVVSGSLGLGRSTRRNLVQPDSRYRTHRDHRGAVHREHSPPRNGRSGSRVFTPIPRPYGRISPISASGCSARACGSARPWR